MAETVASQYQHFVPQFLLRNFSHPFQPPNTGGKKSRHPRRKAVNGMYPKDPVVHNLNLSVDPAVLCEAPVNRIFGQMDMYRDTSKTSAKQQHIEQMFSKLEGQASAVFRKITKSFEQKDNGVKLTRDEKDLVCKFLFLLKYRGSTFHRRFYHETAECYEADDRQLLHDYMEENGYTRPMEVWLNNLKTIMELRMDPEKKWISELPKRMFVDDAMWFIMHVEFMYMAICTPSDPSDEFILTENSYNVFEGPNCFVTDKDSGKVEEAAHTPLHEFAPISPKLMIVLRSFLLPVPEEDADPDVKKHREAFRSLALDKPYKGKVKSILADLPIAKARNNYSMIVNGRLRLNSGETGEGRKDHQFCFQYFPISTEHVQTINGIFLDNAYPGSRIVFETKESFSRTLESYLAGPCTTGKIIMGDDTELRLACLKKLAAVSQSLGSDKEPVWRQVAGPEVTDFEKFRLRILEQRRLFTKIINGKNDPDTEFMQLYKALGGSEETLLGDMEQASLMWKLRVKIDVWSQGLNESLRHRNRLLLIQAYLRLPPHRVWFFVKHVRFAFLERAEQLNPESDLFDHAKLHIEGPEDTIAKASHIIKTEKLAQLMYKAVMNDVTAKECPDVNLWASVNHLNLHGFERIMALRHLAPIEPRYIRDCGIVEVEQLARKQQFEVVRSGQQNRETFGFPFMQDGENVELLTRTGVRSHFLNVLSGRLELSLSEALKDVFFEIVYPTPT